MLHMLHHFAVYIQMTQRTNTYSGADLIFQCCHVVTFSDSH